MGTKKTKQCDCHDCIHIVVALFLFWLLYLTFRTVPEKTDFPSDTCFYLSSDQFPIKLSPGRNTDDIYKVCFDSKVRVKINKVGE